MAIYIVMEPPAGEADGREKAALVRDGFHFLAFLLPAVWLLFHRLWIETLLVVAVSAALSGFGSYAGFGAAGVALSLIVSLYVGLEGSALRLARYRRRGWHEWGAVEAVNAADAEIRYLHEAADERDEVDGLVDARPAALSAVSAPRHAPGPALGLFAYPGKN